MSERGRTRRGVDWVWSECTAEATEREQRKFRPGAMVRWFGRLSQQGGRRRRESK